MPSPKAPAIAGESGSPSAGEPVYLAVGLLRRPHGLRGDLLMEVYTDFPERIRPGTTLFVGDKYQPLKITRSRPHNDGLILGFKGINDPDQAGKYRATTVYVSAEDRPELPEGEYYHHQIIGLSVIDEDEHTLGVVSEIIQTGANDVYVVKTAAGKEVLIPALKDVLLKVDLADQKLYVHLLPGLLDEEKDREA